MICAYDKIYLEQVRTSLGSMLDYAVYDMHIDLDEYMRLFVVSGVAGKIEMGDISTVAGRSGIEMAMEVLDCNGYKDWPEPKYYLNRSPEFWLGWVLGYYQWKTSLSFKEIFDVIPPSKMLKLYPHYHEIDVTHFADKMNEYYMAIEPETKLKKIRRKCGFSQKELSEYSGVPLRTIQQYEQRQKNINKASAESVIMLARALYCEPVEIMEAVK